MSYDGPGGSSAKERLGAMSSVRIARAVVPISVAASALAAGSGRDAAAQSYVLPPQPPVTHPAPFVPLQVMSPFPVVRIVGRSTRYGAQIRLLSVRAPISATIVVRCRRGCRRTSLRRGRGMRRAVRFKRFELNLRSGTIIEVRVSRSGVIGKFTRFRIRRGRRPARSDLCLHPGERAGRACPET